MSSQPDHNSNQYLWHVSLVLPESPLCQQCGGSTRPISGLIRQGTSIEYLGAMMLGWCEVCRVPTLPNDGMYHVTPSHGDQSFALRLAWSGPIPVGQDISLRTL